MKKIAIVAAIASVMGFCTLPAQAAPVLWGNIYTDLYVNDNLDKKESQVIGIEGGVVSENVDIYGTFEHNPNLENEWAKVSGHFRMVEDFSLYAHTELFREGDYAENLYTAGIGYMGFAGEDYNIKPYIGVARLVVDECDTTDSFAFGYSGYYNLSDKTSLSSYADARLVDEKLIAGGGVGIQRDLTALPNVYVGAFYNMNYNEMGVKGYSDSVQLRIGYHF